MATKGTSHDRWKRKDWYTVLSPQLFNEAEVGQILASDPKELVGRTVTTTVYDLTQDERKAHMKLTLEITNTDGKSCHTKINAFLLDNSYLRSLIRRRASKVEAVINVETKDGVKIRVKPLVVTFQKSNTSQKEKIRSALIKRITELGREQAFEAFLLEIISDKIPKILKDEIRKIYPIKNVEIKRIDLTEKFGKQEEKEKKRAKLEKAIAKSVEKLKKEGKALPKTKSKSPLELKAETDDAEVAAGPTAKGNTAEAAEEKLEEAAEETRELEDAEEEAAEEEIEDREPAGEAEVAELDDEDAEEKSG